MTAMPRRRWLASIAIAACSGGAPRAPVTPALPPPPDPAPAVVDAAGATLEPTGVVEKQVATSVVTYRVRASRLVNLMYQLDCLAELANCSHDAFVETWTHDLGLDDADKTALQSWHELRARYGGRIENESDGATETALPLARDMRGIEERIRIAAYDARDADDLWSRLGLFLDPSDVTAGRAVVARLEPKFDKYWATRGDELAAAVGEYALLVARSDIVKIDEQIAKFYQPELGGTTETIDLIARPKHDSPTNAEQIRDHAVVEVSPGSSATTEFPVLAHEMFHAWLAAAPAAKQLALAQQFAGSKDALAIPAYGLLNEVLATALGNGVIARIVDPKDFARRLADPRGFYDDRFIDPVAKAMLPKLDTRLAAGKALFDDDFVAEYLSAVHAAFPTGLPPIAYLRPMAAVVDNAMRDAFAHLAEVSRSGWYWTADASDPLDAHQTLDRGKLWGQVVIVPPTALSGLDAWQAIDKPTLAAVRKQAQAHPHHAFVLTRRRATGVLFVLVADDVAAMIKLVDAFAAVTDLKDGVLSP